MHQRAVLTFLKSKSSQTPSQSQRDSCHGEITVNERSIPRHRYLGCFCALAMFSWRIIVTCLRSKLTCLSFFCSSMHLRLVFNAWDMHVPAQSFPQGVSKAKSGHNKKKLAAKGTISPSPSPRQTIWANHFLLKGCMGPPSCSSASAAYFWGNVWHAKFGLSQSSVLRTHGGLDVVSVNFRHHASWTSWLASITPTCYKSQWQIKV